MDEHKLAEVSPETWKAAIGEFLVQCPVYRYYGNQFPLGQAETAAVQTIFDRIKKRKKA